MPITRTFTFDERTYRATVFRNADTERALKVEIKRSTDPDTEYRTFIEIAIDELAQFRETRDPPFDLPAKFDAATSSLLQLNPDGSTAYSWDVRDLNGDPLTALNQLLQPFIVKIV